MLSSYFTTTFSNKRMVWYEETAETQDYLTFKGHIQQISAEMSQNLGMAFTTSFTVWCPLNTDVAQGDIINDGVNDYNVKFVKELTTGTNTHKQLYVELI